MPRKYCHYLAAAVGVAFPLLAFAIRMNYDFQCEYGEYSYLTPDGHVVIVGTRHCTLNYFLDDTASTEIPTPSIDGWVGDGVFARSRDPWDADGDGKIDCFKSVVPGGNFALSGGKAYGWRTLNGEPDFHGGIDIPATAGTLILNAYDGRVVEASFNSFNGNFVRINHSDGTQTVYLHMEEPASVQEGQIVTAGTLLGYVGNTGNSYGAHLHFQVWSKQAAPRNEQTDTIDPTTKFNLNC